VDWVFPGYKQHKGTPQDRQNFTLLLQTVRDSLQALGDKSGKGYLLSASLPDAAVHLLDIEVQKIISIVDFLNIMTYDLYGAFKLYHKTHNFNHERILK
jgi:chitinase